MATQRKTTTKRAPRKRKAPRPEPVVEAEPVAKAEPEPVEPKPDAVENLLVSVAPGDRHSSVGYGLIIGGVGVNVSRTAVTMTCTRAELLAAAKRSGLSEDALQIDLA